MPSYSNALQDLKCLHQWEKLNKARMPFVFEIGAHDGWYNSNSRLFRDAGCECLLGEADPRHYPSLLKLESPQCRIIMSGLSYKANGLDQYLDANNVARVPDIVFLDIDGGEFYLLAGMQCRPAIICVEFERTLMADAHYIPRIFDYGHQASAVATYELMVAKGYFLADATFNDLIFVNADSLVDPSLACKHALSKTYMLTNYWQLGLNPVHSLFSFRYPEDPGNVFVMYHSTVNKLIQNDRRDLAIDIMRAQFHAVLPYVYAPDSLARLGHIFSGMPSPWIAEWKKAATKYFLLYTCLT